MRVEPTDKVQVMNDPDALRHDPDPDLPARMAALVRGPAGAFLRALGLLTVPPTLDDAALEAAERQDESDGQR